MAKITTEKGEILITENWIILSTWYEPEPPVEVGKCMVSSDFPTYQNQKMKYYI